MTIDFRFDHQCIDLWKVPLAQTEQDSHHLYEILSNAERAQVLRYKSIPAQMIFIASRGFLRMILAHYLQVAPQTIVFKLNAYGKPELDECARTGIFFNLSHTSRLAVYAIAHRPVGVDIESIEKAWPIEPFRDYFSAREIDAILNRQQSERNRAFLFAWVCKEAYLKAKGVGLQYPLRSFDVNFPKSENSPALSAHRLEPQDVGRWFVTEINLDPAHVGALVAERELQKIRYRDLKDLSISGSIGGCV